MKPSIFVISLFTVLTICVSLTAWGQVPEKPQGNVATPEALSAQLVDNIDMGRRTWRPSDPEKKTGVLVVIRLGPGAFATEEFVLTYKTGEKMEKEKKVDVMEKAICRGYSIGSGWAITDEEGKGFKLFTGNPTTDLDFLFEIPKTVSEVTLLYKDKPTGKPVPVKAK